MNFILSLILTYYLTPYVLCYGFAKISGNQAQADFERSQIGYQELLSGLSTKARIFYQKMEKDCQINQKNNPDFLEIEELKYGRAFMKGYHWPYGQVPYEIVDYDEVEKEIIRSVWLRIEKKTCIQFVPKQSYHKDYVSVSRGKPESSVGRIGGKQEVSFGRTCNTVRRVFHETFHLLGFHHEHERYDRDLYVSVMVNNIRPEKLSNFDIIPAKYIDLFGMPYDYGSVTHYKSHTFSKNGYLTLVPKNSSWIPFIGKTSIPSKQDIIKLNKAYGCKRGDTTDYDKVTTPPYQTKSPGCIPWCTNG